MIGRFSYFGSTNAPRGSAAGDFNGDGQNNLAEYVSGTNPSSAQSHLAIKAVSSACPALRFALSWPGATGRVYNDGRGL